MGRNTWIYEFTLPTKASDPTNKTQTCKTNLPTNKTNKKTSMQSKTNKNNMHTGKQKVNKHANKQKKKQSKLNINQKTS